MAIKLPFSPVKADLKQIIADDPLGEFFVWWMGLPLSYESDFEKCLRQQKPRVIFSDS